MVYSYGKFTSGQIAQAKQHLRKKIFFLLLCVDPATKDECSDVDVAAAFENVLNEIGGMNELLNNPPELVQIMSYLVAARHEYISDDFDFAKYRKLVLDAGALVLDIKEV